jgi:hypothetical protein
MHLLAIRSMLAAVAIAGIIIGLGVVALTPAFEAAPASATVQRDDVDRCADGQTPEPGERCRGPVDNESGGGGGVLTIVVSVVVGLAIAGTAFVVLRRQLRSPPPPPRRRSTPGTGAGS